ncbi:MAG: CoA ester lyase [Burkholderiaceae bacterium]
MSSTHSFDARSMLCVPAHIDRFVSKAAERGADVILLDLEDGVAPSSKSQARLALARAVTLLQDKGATVFIRVNNDPALLQEDLAAAVRSGAVGIMLPKVERSDELLRVDTALAREERLAGRSCGEVRVIGLIETPIGVCHASDIAQSSSRLVSIGLGAEDFANAMSIEPVVQALAYPAQAVAIAAVAAGLHPIGLAGAVGDFTDLNAYRATAEHARTIGVRGAVCIHPAQVGVLNEVFGGSRAQADEAARIVDAFDDALARGQGAIALDGKMIDAPIAYRARAFLARYERYAARSHPAHTHGNHLTNGTQGKK